jgi:hypothetical protein
LPASAFANADPIAPAPMIPMVLITMLLVKSDKSGGNAAAAGKGKEMWGSLPALCEGILPPLLPDY